MHFDIWGPFNTTSIHGHRYFLTVLDDFSNFIWVYLLEAKSEASSKLENFVNFVEVHFNAHIKFIQSDNGSVLKLDKFYSSKGIIHQTSCRETPQCTCPILSLMLGMRFFFNLTCPKFFWSYAILHAVFLINRILSPLLNNVSLFKLLFNSSPKCVHLKPFGCLCYISTLKQQQHKFDPQVEKGIFLSFKEGVRGYNFYNFSMCEINVTRDAVSSIFPFQPIKAETAT